ncbi:hypothetical protein EXIGLDRAFT_692743 [Exidia glandulosa HHB12029]|uniref:C2H2-type domain-containing protein n=1 Tax=Exidia glandulosa HHB12029 TaxID=1314781 RepID=A0A165HSK1_EXIGL|nr:hypothetical protein EXIGLDRAFT_692743 [Exidia glandulosa HHB12029]
MADTQVPCRWEGCDAILSSQELLFQHLCDAHVVPENKDGQVLCDKRFRHQSALNYHLKKHRHSQSRSRSNKNASTVKRRATAAREDPHESSSEAEEVSPPPQYKKRKSTPGPEDNRRTKRLRLTNVDKHRGTVSTASAAGTILAEVKAGFERQAEKDITEIFVQTYKKVAAAKLEKMRELIEKL